MPDRRVNPDRRHNHYFKDVSRLDTVDVYRVLSLFNVTDPCLQHAIKKLLVAGGRGAGKDITQDIKEAIDSLDRWNEMRLEDAPSTMPPWPKLDSVEGGVSVDTTVTLPDGRTSFARAADNARSATGAR